MTYDPYDFDPEKSPWFLGATTFEGKVGDWMRVHFALEDDHPPHEMADLLRRLGDRDTAAPAYSHARRNAGHPSRAGRPVRE